MLLPLQVIRNYLTLCPFCLKWEDLSNTRIREGLQATLGVKLRSQGSWLPGRGQGTGVGAGEPPGGVLLSNPPNASGGTLFLSCVTPQVTSPF